MILNGKWVQQARPASFGNEGYWLGCGSDTRDAISTLVQGMGWGSTGRRLALPAGALAVQIDQFSCPEQSPAV